MAKYDSTQTDSSICKTLKYGMYNGGRHEIEVFDLVDYANMRSCQLSALLKVIFLANDCEHSMMGEVNQTNVNWLATTLADELEKITSLLGDEALKKSAAKEPLVEANNA